MVKGAIIEIDATPFRQWYEAHVSSDTVLLPFAPSQTDKAIIVLIAVRHPSRSIQDRRGYYRRGRDQAVQPRSANLDREEEGRRFGPRFGQADQDRYPLRFYLFQAWTERTM